MAVVKPFICYRPTKAAACKVAALPYDVYNRLEACEAVKKEPLSFLAIDRAETQLEDSVDAFDNCVYEKARDLTAERISQGIYIKDETAEYFVYELVMDGRAQTGLVACSSIDDYQNNTVKKHENTRADKELDRIRHVDVINAQTGPIFLAYRGQKAIDNIIAEIKEQEPIYDFISEDGIGHRVWLIKEEVMISQIESSFLQIPCTYIADGHHRAASAVKVGLKRRAENPDYTGKEPFNYFLSVLFPDDQLMILPYNRVVKDLNHLTKKDFFNKLSEKFDILCFGSQAYWPMKKRKFGMFYDNCWYELTFKGELESDNPVSDLDVSILQNNLLGPILSVGDPRIDKRIDFVGGIRGLKELERRVQEDMVVAFSLYPTSMEELFAVSDSGYLMPPKSTWFEPKLRSGLFLHKLSI